MTYAEALAYIASLEPRGWRLGLDRMGEFVRRAGLSSAVDGSERKYIHVAGTNGKGSVTAFLQSLLVESGVRTGAYFSPFVVDPRERVQLGREPISEEGLAELTTELKLVADAMDGTEFSGVTEFEFKTALGFLAWQRGGSEWVALETGLGGRLDATNVVTPAASIIVSIGLDHQSILGETIEAIAFEKAGIIKPGVPLILGDVPITAADVIRGIAGELSAPMWQFGKEVKWDPVRAAVDTPFRSFSGLKPGLHGTWQGHNLSLAIAALIAAGARLTDRSVLTGSTRAFAPGRYQRVRWRDRTLILDGAHNADSALALAETVRADLGEGVGLMVVSNMLFGHEPAEFYLPLAGIIDQIFVPPINFHRTRPQAEMAAALRALGIRATAVESIGGALEQAHETTSEKPILVTGSFYLVGEVARLLQLAEAV